MMPKAIRNPSNAIIEALSKRGKATWSDLLEDTRLSKGALSSHLNEMLSDKKISVETDVSRRPPKTLYVLVDPTEELKKNMKKKSNPFFFNVDGLKEPDYNNPDYVALAIYVGQLISTLKDREKARQLLKDYLEFTMNYLAFDVVAAINFAYLCSGNGSPKAIGAREENEKILKIWKNHHKALNEDRIIQAIFWTAFKNSDIALTGKVPVISLFADEISKKMDQSFIQKFMNKITEIEKDKKDS